MSNKTQFHRADAKRDRRLITQFVESYMDLYEVVIDQETLLRAIPFSDHMQAKFRKPNDQFAHNVVNASRTLEMRHQHVKAIRECVRLGVFVVINAKTTYACETAL